MSLLEIHVKDGGKCVTKSDLFSLMMYLTGLFGFLLSAFLSVSNRGVSFWLLLASWLFVIVPIFVREKEGDGNE